MVGLAAGLAACSTEPIATCRDDLRGVYAAGPLRWMVLDSGATLEAYPLFPDAGAPRAAAGAPRADGAAALEIGPRVVDLTRTGDRLAGTLRRRYMQQAARCDARVPVQVTRCAGDTLELVLADPSPPTAFAPCTWPSPGPSRVERWRRAPREP